MNPFKYSNDNKRYYTLSYYNKTHGMSAYKAVIDAGFTCPNIDGSRGRGGCIFCSGGSGYFTASPLLSVEKQLDIELERIRKKHADAAVIAYFQAHTNTYAPLDLLRGLFEKAIAHEGVCGLSIATRADCLPADILDYLAGLSKRTYLTVELGLQTIHEKTASLINRCHNYDEFVDSFMALKERGIRTCVHIINGLPGEDKAMMLATARELGALKPEAVKLQLLHVIRGTRLESLYNSGEYTPMTRDEYVDAVVGQLELLPAETVIERITGDGDKTSLVAPTWSADKLRVLAAIDKELERRNTWQGRL